MLHEHHRSLQLRCMFIVPSRNTLTERERTIELKVWTTPTNYTRAIQTTEKFKYKVENHPLRVLCGRLALPFAERECCLDETFRESLFVSSSVLERLSEVEGDFGDMDAARVEASICDARTRVSSTNQYW